MDTLLVAPTQTASPILIEAVYRGDATEVRHLLNRGVDVNVHPGDSLGMILSDGPTDIAKSFLLKNMSPKGKFSSALLLAVSKQDTDIISILLEKGADVNLDNHAWFTQALQKAVMDGRPANSELLVEYGDAVHSTSPTALCEAISSGNEAIVRRLLEAGADANFDNGLPLRAASLKGLEKVVTLLLTAGAKQVLNEYDWFHKFMDTQQYLHAKNLLRTIKNAGREDKRPLKLRQTPLLEAVTAGNMATISLLLAQNPACETEYDEALWHASKLGNLALVEQLVGKGANVNGDLLSMDDIGTCLVAASGNGHEEVVAFLLKSGAECNARLVYQHEAMTPLESASAHGHVSIAKLLLSSGADPNFHSWSGPATPLCAAVNGGNRESINLLIEHGADVNYHQMDRDGPLECAANNGDLEVFELLLKKGARIATRADVCRTTIQAAGYGGNEQVIQLVLNLGADIDSVGATVKDKYIGTALQLAALNSHDGAVRLLCENGADINRVRSDDWDKRNALGFAASGGNVQVVQYLLERGSRETVYGGPLRYAAEFGKSNVIKYLLENHPEHASESHVIVAIDAAADKHQWPVIPNLLLKLYGPPLPELTVKGLFTSGDEELVKFMLRERIRPRRVLLSAIEQSKHRIYQLLLEDDEVMAFEKSLSVRVAAWIGDISLVKALIEQGADINDTQPLVIPPYEGIEDNATALHWAANSQNPQMVQLLLDYGADISSESTFRAAIQAARGAQNIIELLLRKKAQPQAVPKEPLLPTRHGGSVSDGRAAGYRTIFPDRDEDLIKGIEVPIVEYYRSTMSYDQDQNSGRQGIRVSELRRRPPNFSSFESEESDEPSARGVRRIQPVHARVQFQEHQLGLEDSKGKECNLTLRVDRQGPKGYLSHRLRIYRPHRTQKIDVGIDSDVKLFKAMRETYLRHLLGYRRRFFSMKSLKRITVRSYTSSTRPEIVPFDDESLKELMSLVNDPSKVDTEDTWIEWVFKLKLGKRGRKHILVFEEGWDGTRVAIAGSLPFMGSFLVAIIWSSFGGDLQTVFSIASFVLAAGSGLLALLAVLSTLGG